MKHEQRVSCELRRINLLLRKALGHPSASSSAQLLSSSDTRARMRRERTRHARRATLAPHAPATSRHFTDLSIRCQQTLLSGIIVLENHSHESIKVHSCRAATTASQLSLLSRRHHNKNILHTPTTRHSSASAATSHHQSPLTHRRVQTSAQTQCDVIMRITHAVITLNPLP